MNILISLVFTICIAIGVHEAIETVKELMKGE